MQKPAHTQADDVNQSAWFQISIEKERLKAFSNPCE